MENDLQQVMDAFGLSGPVTPLAGGTVTTFRIGTVVLKRIGEESLENNHSTQLAAWMAEWMDGIAAPGFRLPKPVRTVAGAWITTDGWTAMHFLPGRHARPDDIPTCIQAISALHTAVKEIFIHPAMEDNRTAWGFAHRGCWGEPPRQVQPELRSLLGQLYMLRKPIETTPWQLIHGDLNLSNLLIEPGLEPAILDFSPFWGPPEFALAIFANFSGPRRRDMRVLPYFEGVPNFKQLLIRAAIRMLLVVSALDGLEGWEESEEKWAAEQIIDYVQTPSPR